MRLPDDHARGRVLPFRSREREDCCFPGSEAADIMMRVGQHVNEHVGPIDRTLHRDADHPLSIVLFHVPPSKERPFHALVTAGMSQLAMKPPRGAEGCTHAELVLLLPPEWDLSPEGLGNLRNTWPLREIELLARMPHEEGTWLWCGHSMGNGHPLEPLAPSTRFVGGLMVHPDRLPRAFQNLRLEDRTIHFLAYVPLYRDELGWLLRHGKTLFTKRMAAAGVTELLDPTRPSILARRPHRAT